MAEVATKKSINVVSNKKNEVCSVPSNNGLIDLESITASNDQLISLCDNNDDEDDLILTNNTRNDLDNDEKSLQELIESELALRISSTAEDSSIIENEEQNDTPSQPEPIKRIILDRRESPLDINAEFIAVESQHCAIIEDPYSYQNGHTLSNNEFVDSPSDENIQPDPTMIDFRDEENSMVNNQIDTEDIVNFETEDPNSSQISETIDKPIDLLNITSDSVGEGEKDTSAEDMNGHSMRYGDKYEEEEEFLGKSMDDSKVESVQNNGECEDSQNKNIIDTWTDQDDGSTDGQQIAQFSDNFETFPEEAPMDQTYNLLESTVDTIPLHITNSGDQLVEFLNEHEETTLKEPVLEFSHVSQEFPDALGEKSNENLVDTKNTELNLKLEENELSTAAIESRNFNDVTVSQSETSKSEAASTQEFIDIERRVLSEEITDNILPDEIKTLEEPVSPEKLQDQASNSVEEDELKEEANCSLTDDQNQIAESSSELSVSESTFIEKTEVIVSENNVTILSETKCVDLVNELDHDDLAPRDLDSWTTVEEATRTIEYTNVEQVLESGDREEPVAANDDVNEVTSGDNERRQDHSLGDCIPRAPLATPDDETSDVSNACDSESREETITTTSVVTSTNVKGGTKTKKKKIEGVAGNDASPNNTPRTKKTKKSKKSDLEKENISVCRSFGDISNLSEGDPMAFGKTNHTMENEEKSSFNKFDALSKKTVLHVRCVDASKVQQQLNAVGQNGDANQNCRSCGKVVFQMEQTKAEGLVWHKNCFRCVQCSKQLNVDNYESHESTLYCKPHFKELFQPKPVEESDQPVRPRKPELIIRENEPKELPPDVVRASDKPDLGLEELSSLNVKSRFQVFEKAGTDTTNEIERSPSQIAVKRSPSILSKLAKFQAKGMDIGVADESLNGIPYEESSESEEEEDPDENEEADTEIVKAKRATRERPISFTKMDDIKSRWETTSQQGRREVQREARKEEIAGIRSRLFMGKQGKMKEMYQQAVAGSERVTKINAAEEIQHSTHARSIKERFERGEPLATSDDETDSKPKTEKADEEVIAAGISRKSRSLFLELDATAAKTGRPVTPVNPKTPAETPRRARDMESPEREIYRDPDVVRAEDRVNDVVHTDTARKMLSIFRQMEENATKKEVPNGPKPLKRFTPPPEDKFAKPTASDSDEDEEEEGEDSEGEESTEERDPNYVRASDKVEDEFLKQAQNAARAKTLCAKFEHWDETDGKVSTNQHIAEMEMAQGEQSSIESARSLKARFESLGSQTTESPRTPKVKVNRFVEIQTTCMDVCESCEKKVYPLEKVETNNKIFHKQCFRCLQCNCILRMDTFTLNNGKLYCIPHFKQLFITRGNYDEGFGVDPHKNKWSSNANNTSPSAIAVSNGDI